MKRILLIMLSLIIVSFVGCAKDEDLNNSDPIDENNSEVNDMEVEDTFLPETSFGIDLVKKMQKLYDDDNFFVSPLSIKTALSMTYLGASGQTKEEMAEVLGYKDIEDEQVISNYRYLSSRYNNTKSDIDINFANAIMINEKTKVYEEFLESNQFGNTMIDKFDFFTEGSLRKINNWIETETNGKIQNMLDRIDENAVMYLINAIYFNGKWASPFDEEHTFEADFQNIDDSTSTVLMMSQKGTFEYSRFDNYEVAKIPYGDKNFSMYVMIPVGRTINQMISDLTMEDIEKVTNELIETNDLVLQIPKFKCEYGMKIINESLKELGIKEAFTPQADFDKITDEEIWINRVMHKAAIEVDEKGSEAAAATVVEMTKSAALKEPITFIADRPFMYFIYDEETDGIMFIGKMAKAK